MKLYHATTNRYEMGSDLLSLRSLWDQGILSEEEVMEVLNRWEERGEDYIARDGSMVSLTADLTEAEYVRSEFNGGEGRILVIDGDALEADGLLRANEEGYPAVWDQIPASYILAE